MKRYYSILILWIILFSTCNEYISAQTKSYRISFDMNDFEFIENTTVTIVPDKTDYFFMEDTLQPALPYIACPVLIPPNTRITDFSVSIEKSVVKRGVIIAPNPKVSLMHAQNYARQTTNPPEYLPQIYPEESVVLTAEHKMKGYVFAGFILSPFIYNAETKELSFISEVTIELQLEQSRETAIIRGDVREDIKSMVINPEEVELFYSDSLLTQRGNGSETIEYLVITSNALVGYFKPLVDWKAQKGVRAKTISLEYIYANYPGATNQLKIKTCLKDYYDNYGLKWALLGGDNTIVPVQMCFMASNVLLPCDLFYACFDNAFDWNANGNDKIGEYQDNVDYYPEIYLSRLPIRNSTHVTAYINKLLKYEKNPATSNYVKKMLLAGVRMFNTPNNNGQSDAHIASEIMYNQYIAPFWNGTKYRFYDTGTDFPGDSAYDVTVSNLQTQINNGYHFLHVATHGGITTWGMETGNAYSSANASALQNVNASIILTVACHTNGFDQPEDPCLSEAFIRNPNGACVAYWGSSRENIADTVYSIAYNDKFYNTLFQGFPISDSYKFAAITSYTKQQFVPQISAANLHKFLQFSLNAIGDPEMSIYTENPVNFTNVVISKNGNAVTVNANVPGCTIVMSSLDDGQSYFQVAKNVSSYTFTNVNVSSNITVSKHNYIPYLNIYTCQTNNFTNQTVNSNKTVTGCNINVQNVTVTNNAKLILDAESETTIEGNFEVQLGSEFEIK